MKLSLRRAKTLVLSLLLLTAPGCGQPSVDFAFEEVRYTISGGVAGFDRTIRIASDGSYRVSEAGRTVGTGHISAASLQELKRLLQAVDWVGLGMEYIDRKVVDSLHQSLAVRTIRVEHTTTVGTGGNPPQPVAALLEFLDKVLRDAYRP